MEHPLNTQNKCLDYRSLKAWLDGQELVKSEAFWGINRLSQAQLEPVRRLLQNYIELKLQSDLNWEEVNQGLRLDLESMFSSSPKLSNINSSFVSFLDHDSDTGFYLMLDVKNREIRIELSLPEDHKFGSEQCASLVIKSLNKKRKYQPIVSMLRANSQLLGRAIEIDLNINKQIRSLESDLRAVTKNYFWAESRLPLEFASMIDNFDLSLKYIQDNLFLKKPESDSKYNLLWKAFSLAEDCMHEPKVSLRNIPRYDRKGTEELVIEILKTTGMISDQGAIPFGPYSYQRADYLIEQSSALLDNLKGLPGYLSYIVRSVYAAYVFGGLNYSGFRNTINEFSDREFKGLLINQIEFPRAALVRLAEGDDPVMAADAFNALMKQSTNFFKLFGLKDPDHK